MFWRCCIWRASDSGSRRHFSVPRLTSQRAEAEEWFRMAAEEGDPLALRIVEMIEDDDPEE